MNIVHVIASPSPGGIESFVKDLAIEATRHDQFVHICFLETASEAGTSESFENKYLAELESVGIRYFFMGQNARWRLLSGARKMQKYVRENSIDIYHSHLTYGIIFGAFVHIPRIYTHHSIDMRVSRFVFGFLSRWVDRLIGISDVCAEALTNHTNRDVLTINNGVNVEKFDGTGLLPRKIEDTIRCVSVGRICKEKNYEVLVDALAIVPDAIRSRLFVTIAGSGAEIETAKLQARINNNGLKRTVQLSGTCNDIPGLLASSQVFLMSSSVEGYPLALIEASVSGLPCVVTDAGGCREIIEKCHNGIVVDKGNKAAFADAIARLVSDPIQFTEYSRSALRGANRFSVCRASVHHISLYRTLLN